jgi:glycosyltransferase involved in cell wall biosynthesis
MTSPLISCVMPTFRRRRFLPQALRCFASQSYTNSELIVVDDSARSAASLCEGVPRVRYIHLKRPTPTGAKLNLGIQAARGDILQKLDDDDYYRQDFLESSVRHFPKRGLSSTVVVRCCFLVLFRDSPVVRHSGHGWKPGGTLCFHRKLWEKIPFRRVKRSEDSWLLADHEPRIVRVCDAGQYILVRHGRNTWNAMAHGQTADEYLRERPVYRGHVADIVPREAAALYRRIFRWR